MIIKKIFYTLEDIKKQISIIPTVFILFLTLLSLIMATVIVHNNLDKEIKILIQEDTFYKDRVLKSYIEDIKYNTSSVFDTQENGLRKYVSQVKGYIQALEQRNELSLDNVTQYFKVIQAESKIEFVVFNVKSFDILYGKNIVSYLQSLSNAKIETQLFRRHVVENIYTLGEENIQYWQNRQNRDIRVSYFKKIDSQGWFIGGFSKVGNIKKEFKRAIFESILIKSKVIDGHFWFYDYLNNIVFNYYNQARAFDLEDIIKDNRHDKKILNLYYKHPNLLNNQTDHIYNFAKYNFLVTVKTENLEAKKESLKFETRKDLLKIYTIIIILSGVILLFIRMFTSFITSIFTRYNRRLELRSDKFKRWKERYELAIVASNDGFWDINLKDNKIYFSEKWLEMFGYEKDEIVTLEDWFDLIHFEDKAIVKEALDEHLENKTKNFIVEYRIRNKYNVYKWILVRGKVFKDSKGRPNRMLMSSMDIDDSKQISKELKDVELLVDVGRIVIFKCKNDTNLTVDYVSKSITSYGYTKNRFEEQLSSYYDFVHAEDVEKLKEAIQSAINKEQPSFSIVYRVIESNGAVKWVYNRTIFLKDYFGNITHLYGYINDITQMKMDEEELKLRVEYEVQKNIEKDRILIHQNKLASMGEMLGNIAHQWRQPLNNISLLIHFVRDNYQSKHFTQENMNENIKDIKLQIDYMSKTIDDFRNFYQPTKEKNRFNIKEAIYKSYEIVKTEFEKENISIDIQGDEVEINSYENELQQVIVNILNNAKDAALEKRSKEEFEPKVEVNIRKINKKAIIDLSNNCGTISNKVLARIFEPYFTTKFENQGTGIGLYMSKTIIEKNMKGAIGAKVTENGLNFSIILPI